MSTTNPVHKSLFPTGNAALLAAGSRVTALAIGQLGVFNYHTGLSVDGTVAGDCKDIFLAVGADPLATGAIADIEKSAGQVIQIRNARAYTFKGYVAGISKVMDITGFKAMCQTEYTLKVNLNNGLGYELNGFTLINKTFEFTTGCCADQCTPCALGDTNELVAGLIAAVNADPEALLTAIAVDVLLAATVNTAPTADANTVVTIGGKYIYTVALLDADTTAQAAQKIVDAINAANDPIYATISGSTITVHGNAGGSTFTVLGAGITVNAVAVTKATVADVPAYVAANPGASLGIRITGNPLAPKVYGDINNNYTKGRSTDFGVSLIQGFTCNGTVTEVTALQRPEGLGYDAAQIEFSEQGWRHPPYYLSSVLGQAAPNFYTNSASRTATYNQFSLAYDQESVGGWLEYKNNLETIIQVPCADGTTAASIATVLDAIFTQFGPMAGDVTANGDCTNVRTGLLTPATDGLESLA